MKTCSSSIQVLSYWQWDKKRLRAAGTIQCYHSLGFVTNPNATASENMLCLYKNHN